MSPQKAPSEREIQLFASKLEKISRKDWDPPAATSKRGITICAGGARYFASAYILVRLLRHHGCRLPIEMWHVGNAEINYKMRRLLIPYDVKCVDADLSNKGRIRNLAGWPLKPYSI